MADFKGSRTGEIKEICVGCFRWELSPLLKILPYFQDGKFLNNVYI